MDEALLWAVFGRIIDPPLQTDWIFNITLFAGSSLVAHTGLTAAGLIGAEAAGTVATATITTTPVGPIMSAADAAKIIVSAERVGRGLASDAYHRAASFLTQAQLASGTTSLFRCKDGVFRTLLVVKDVVVNGVRGFVEFIVDANGTVTHQLFKAY